MIAEMAVAVAFALGVLVMLRGLPRRRETRGAYPVTATAKREQERRIERNATLAAARGAYHRGRADH